MLNLIEETNSVSAAYISQQQDAAKGDSGMMIDQDYQKTAASRHSSEARLRRSGLKSAATTHNKSSVNVTSSLQFA